MGKYKANTQTFLSFSQPFSLVFLHAQTHTHALFHPQKRNTFPELTPTLLSCLKLFVFVGDQKQKVEDKERRIPQDDCEGVCKVRGREAGGGGGAAWLANNPLSLVMSWDQANPTFTD